MSAIAPAAIESDFNRRSVEAGWTIVCDPAFDFETPQLKDALAVWRQAAGGRPMPARADLTARLLKPFLPDVAFVAVVPESTGLRFRLRLIGTRAAEVLGEHSGKFFDEAIPLRDAARWIGVATEVVKQAKPLRFYGLAEYRRQDYLIGEMLVAPLCDGGQAPDGLLYVMYFIRSQETKMNPRAVLTNLPLR